MMEQTFEYPNLLSGTRSGKGWTWIRGTGGYNPDTGITLYNTKASKCRLLSPNVVLHTGRTYSLSFYAASTDNMAGSDIYVLDKGGASDSYQWIGASKLAVKPPAGGRGSHGRSRSIPVRGMARHSISASTTTAPWTAARLWSGSATSCSWRARRRTRGRLQRGRCGLNER